MPMLTLCLSPQGLRCSTHFFPATVAGQQAWADYLMQHPNLMQHPKPAPSRSIYAVLWLVAWAEDYKLFPLPQQKLRRSELQTWQRRRFAETWPELWDKELAQIDPNLAWAVAHPIRLPPQDWLCWQVVKDVPAIVPWLRCLSVAGIALAGVYSRLNALPAYLVQTGITNTHLANTKTAKTKPPQQFAVLLPILSGMVNGANAENAENAGWQQLWCTAEQVLVSRSFPHVATWQAVYAQEMPRLYEYVRSQGIFTPTNATEVNTTIPVYVFSPNSTNATNATNTTSTANNSGHADDLPPPNAAFPLQVQTLAADFLTSLTSPYQRKLQGRYPKGMVQLAPAQYLRAYRWQQAKRVWYGANLAISAGALLAAMCLGQILHANQRLLPLLAHGAAYQAVSHRAWQEQHPLPPLPVTADSLQELATQQHRAQHTNQQLHQQWQAIQHATTLATTANSRIVLRHLAWQGARATGEPEQSEPAEAAEPRQQATWQLEGRLLATTARHAADGLREYVNSLHAQGLRSTILNAPGNAIAPEQWSAGQLGFSPDGDGRFRFRLSVLAAEK